MSYLLKPLQAGSQALANRLVMPPITQAQAAEELLTEGKADLIGVVGSY